MYRKIIGLLLLIVASIGLNNITSMISDLVPVKPEPYVGILNIDTPNIAVQDRVKIFSSIISDPTDRAQIALFNYEFASRIQNWDTNAQKVNDVYSLAGKIFFQNRLVNKYENLSDEIVNLLEEIITDDDHVLTESEKIKIHEYFTGLSWALIQKDK